MQFSLPSAFHFSRDPSAARSLSERTALAGPAAWIRALGRIAAISALGLSATARASLTLQWTNNALAGSATGYAIERSSPGGDFVALATVGPTLTSYEDLTALSTSGDTYRVRATSPFGLSAYSNVASLGSVPPAPPDSAPVFYAAPTGPSVAVNGTVTITGSAFGSPAPTYQWQFSVPASGAWAVLTNTGVYSNVTTNALTITGATAAMNNGLYRLVAFNAAAPAGVMSGLFGLVVTPAVVAAPPASPALPIVNAPVPPVPAAPPPAAPVQPAAPSQPAAPIQTPVPSLPITPVTVDPSSSGSGPAPVAFLSAPVAQTVSSGSTVVFCAATSASAPATSYQWRLNGAPIAGATSARLVVADATPQSAAGTYTVAASNAAGAVVSPGALLSFASTSDVGRLVNLSVLNSAGGGQLLTLGFVVGGAGTTGSESLLVRASGPALAGFGVTGGLADPTLSLFQGSSLIGYNDNWAATATNQAQVTAVDAAVGAFPLTQTGSLDAAVVTALPSNSAYTVQIGGNGPAAGSVLGEVYDATPAGAYTPATPRLVNLSSLGQIAVGGSLTGGFVIGGTTSVTVLIRVTGPALVALRVAGALADPQVTLHTVVNGQDTVLAANAGWAGDAQIAAASQAVFAFALTDPSSHDAALLITLPPGAYTAVAASSSAAGGTALVEIYDVP